MQPAQSQLLSLYEVDVLVYVSQAFAGHLLVRLQVHEKSFVMRGVTFIISNMNETDWTVTPAYNVTCGDAPGGPSLSPEAVQAGIDKTFVPR